MGTVPAADHVLNLCSSRARPSANSHIAKSLPLRPLPNSDDHIHKGRFAAMFGGRAYSVLDGEIGRMKGRQGTNHRQPQMYGRIGESQRVELLLSPHRADGDPT